jgi:hypothetical protein
MTPSARRFLDAWCGWRGSRLLPRRADIQLVDIKDLLPMVTLIEIRSASEMVFRVAGSELRDYFGADITGGNYVDMEPAQSRPQSVWRMTQEIGRPCGALVVCPYPLSWGFTVLMETVSLPIDPDHPSKPRMMLSLMTRLESRAGGALPDGALRLSVSGAFGFIDIGAGVPDRTEPD